MRATTRPDQTTHSEAQSGYRVSGDPRHARRLLELSANCDLLLAGLHNDEDDTELVFRGFTLEEVLRAGESDPNVLLTLQRLDPSQFRRLFMGAP